MIDYKNIDHNKHAIVIPKNLLSVAATAANQEIEKAIQQDLRCTLTIGEAQEVFRKLQRRPLSERSLQRYCKSAAILAELNPHSQGTEWIINEPSLIKFIEDRYPIVGSEQLGGVSATGKTEDVATGDKKPVKMPTTTNLSAPPSSKVTDKLTFGVASGEEEEEFAEPGSVGEKRTRGELLVENARLTAELKGKEEVISTLKEHDTYMREEAKENRSLIHKLTNQVAGIASQMLGTMQSIGTAGKAFAPSKPTEHDDQSHRE